MQVKFQNYKLEAEERLISVVVAVIVIFGFLVTLSIIFLFLNIAVAHSLNEIYEHDYWGYLVIVIFHASVFIIFLILISFRRARMLMYSLLIGIIQSFFNFIFKKILRQGKREKDKAHQTEIQNILSNKKLKRNEKQKQLSYIEDRYEKELGQSLKSVQKSLTYVAITSAASYISFRLAKRILFSKKRKNKTTIIHKTEKKPKGMIKGVKKKITNMAVNTILDTVSEKVQKTVQNQMRKNNKDED